MATPVNPFAARDVTPHRIDFATFLRLGGLDIHPARAELIDGIVFDMSPKGDRHYLVQSELIEQLVLAGRGRYRLGPEPTLKVDDDNGPMPDVLVTPRGAPVESCAADLVVEVSDSSLDYDRGEKRALYARGGVCEYWVVDLKHDVLERYLPAEATAPAVFRPGDALSLRAYPDVRIDVEAVFAAAGVSPDEKDSVRSERRKTVPDLQHMFAALDPI